jgi:hypothetical protein
VNDWSGLKHSLRSFDEPRPVQMASVSTAYSLTNGVAVDVGTIPVNGGPVNKAKICGATVQQAILLPTSGFINGYRYGLEFA